MRNNPTPKLGVRDRTPRQVSPETVRGWKPKNSRRTKDSEIIPAAEVVVADLARRGTHQVANRQVAIVGSLSCGDARERDVGECVFLSRSRALDLHGVSLLALNPRRNFERACVRRLILPRSSPGLAKSEALPDSPSMVSDRCQNELSASERLPDSEATGRRVRRLTSRNGRCGWVDTRVVSMGNREMCVDAVSR